MARYREWGRTLGAELCTLAIVGPAFRTTNVSRACHLVCQLVEQSLGIDEVGSVEAFGEPVVGVGEHRVRLAATALLHEQPHEAGRGAQLQRFRTLLPRILDGAAKAVLSFYRL
jgi:hypothetical protein